VSGVTQIVRGVAAVPASIMAPRQGKWWNSSTGEWELTDLTKVSPPENDDDLLKTIEDDLDSKHFTVGGKPSGEVVDMYYYEILEVDTTADESKIKRQYYLLARKYHPDKNDGDNDAADKFKTVAEAYQVLSDSELRAKYDKGGRDALSGDKTSGMDSHKADPSLLLAYLFGSDKFSDYVGRLATSTSAMLGDTTKLSVVQARTLQERRVARLALKLATRISAWVSGDFETVESAWTSEAVALSMASYGWEMLQVIGMAYEVSAVQFLGSNDSGIGMPSIAEWAQGKNAANKLTKAGSKNQWATMVASMDAMKIQQEYGEKIAQATSDEEKAKLEQEMAEATTGVMLRIIWTTTSVDVVTTIHEVCQMVFFDQSVDKETREKRANAVKKLGAIFQGCPEPQHPAGQKKSAKELFEEAAMAATLETIKRKDESTYEAGGYDNH
jgi:hypothetical protein